MHGVVRDKELLIRYRQSKLKVIELARFFETKLIKRENGKGSEQLIPDIISTQVDGIARNNTKNGEKYAENSLDPAPSSSKNRIATYIPIRY